MVAYEKYNPDKWFDAPQGEESSISSNSMADPTYEKYDPEKWSDTPPEVKVEPEKEYDVWGGVKDLGKLAYDIPVQTMGAIGRLSEDTNPEARKTWADEAIDKANKRAEQRYKELAATGEGDKYLVPGIQREDIVDTSASTGFTLTSMLAGAPGGVLTATGHPYAGVPIALAGSGKAAHKMDSIQFTQQIIDSYRDTVNAHENRNVAPQEVDSLVNKSQDIINKHALWEAIPEAIGNVATMSGIGALFTTALGKNVGMQVFKKIAGMYGVELTTETITQTGQQGAEAEAGLTVEPKRSQLSLSDQTKSLKEVAPSVMLLTTGMGGAGYVGGKAYRAVTDLPSDIETTDIETLSSLKSALDSGAATTEEVSKLKEDPVNARLIPGIDQILSDFTEKADPITELQEAQRVRKNLEAMKKRTPAQEDKLSGLIQKEEELSNHPTVLAERQAQVDQEKSDLERKIGNLEKIKDKKAIAKVAEYKKRLVELSITPEERQMEADILKQREDIPKQKAKVEQQAKERRDKLEQQEKELQARLADETLTAELRVDIQNRLKANQDNINALDEETLTEPYVPTEQDKFNEKINLLADEAIEKDIVPFDFIQREKLTTKEFKALEAEVEKRQAKPKDPSEMTRDEYDNWRVEEYKRITGKDITVNELDDAELEKLSGKKAGGVSEAGIISKRKGQQGRKGAFTHELFHQFDFTNNADITMFINDMEFGDGISQNHFDNLLYYLEKGRKEGKLHPSNKIDDHSEIAQSSIDAYFRDKEGLRKWAPELVEKLDSLGIDSLLKLSKPYNEITKAAQAEPLPADTQEEVKTVESLNNLNPTGGIFAENKPEERVTAPLGKNITTLDKTSGGKPGDLITIYRGTTGDKIVPGDYVTTNKQLAKDYAGTRNVVELEVKKGDILDDVSEPLGEEYIYRPDAYKEGKAPTTPAPEIGTEPKTETNETITQELNKQFQGYDIKYDGEFPGVGYQFTPQSGEFKGRTFTAKKMSVASARDTMVEQFGIEKQAPKKETSKETGVEGPATGEVKPELSETSVIEVPIKKIALSKEVPQFKEGADEKGVVERLRGKYKRIGTAPVVLWERENGDLELITGRHRFELAQRKGESSIPSQILKESDGFTKEKAAIFDAESNIRDEKGSVRDYASYFRQTKTTREQASLRGLLSRAKGQDGFTIGRHASDELYANFRNGLLNDKKTAAIAEAAPDNNDLQIVGMKYADSHSAQATANYLQAVKAVAPKKNNTEQLNLFGEDDKWQIEADKMAKVVTDLEKDLKQERIVLKSANKLNKDKYKDFIDKYGISPGNKKAVNKRLEELATEIIKTQNWTSYPDIKAKVKKLAGVVDNQADSQDEINEELQGDLFNQNKPIELQPGLFSKKDLLKAKATDTVSKPAVKKAKKKADAKQGDLFNEKPKQEDQLELFPVSVDGKILPQSKTEGSGDAKKGNKVGAKDRLEQIVRSGVKTTGNIQHSGLVVNSDSDVASLLIEIAHLPTESLYTVTVDKDGTIIEVYYYSKGGMGSSTANATEIVGRSFTHDNAAKVYFVHNHPAGSTEPSGRSDIPITKKLTNLFKLKKMPSSNIILGRDESDNSVWGKFDINGAISLDNPVLESAKDTAIPVKEKAFLQTKRGPIVTPSNIEDVLKGKESGFLLLDSRLHEMGFLEFKPGMRQREIAAELLAAMDKTNATAFAPYNKEGSKKERTKFFIDMVESFKSVGKDGSVAFTGGPGGIKATGIPKHAVQEIGAIDNAKAVFQTSKDLSGQTKTPAFKKWFGKSKVVDENGDPLVVYHGTDAEFTVFDADKSGSGPIRGNPIAKYGFFFSQNKRYAEIYSGEFGKTLEVYLSISNPYKLDMLNEGRALKDSQGLYVDEKVRPFIEKVKANGHDGIEISMHGGIKEYMTFNRTQIKSATDNIGTFDPNNPDIRYQTDQTPGAGVNIKDIQASFPGQDVFVSPDKSISIRLKNGQGIVIRSTKSMPDGTVQYATESGRMSGRGIIMGATVNNTIYLSPDYATKGTVKHELYHALKNMNMITKEDDALLMAEFHRLRKAGGLDINPNTDVNKSLSDAENKRSQREENKANIFNQMLKMREEYRGTKLGRIIQKVMDFLDGLLNINRMSLKKLAKEAETGKIFSRKVNGKEFKVSIPQYEQAAAQWYSAITNAVDSVQQKAMPAQQWKAMLESNKFKQAGVKPDELYWSGILNELDSRKGKVTKQEVLDYLAENNVRVEEVVKGSNYLERLTENEYAEFSKLLKDVDYLGFDTSGLAVSAIRQHSDWASRWDVPNEKRLVELGDKWRTAEIEQRDDTKFSGHLSPWNIEDLEGYKEILMTLPVKPSTQAKKASEAYQIKLGEKYGKENDTFGITRPQWTAEEKKEVGRLSKLANRENVRGSADAYKSPHYDEPNILAHMRIGELTIPSKQADQFDADYQSWAKNSKVGMKPDINQYGKDVKAMHVFEIQSDWAKAGRDKGFKSDAKDIKAVKRGTVFGFQNWEFTFPNGRKEVYSTKGEVSEKEAVKEFLENSEKVGLVPDAPFVTKTGSYITLAMKKMVRYAVENNFESIVFDTGQISADRYDLRNQVDNIQYEQLYDATGGKGWYYNIVANKDDDAVVEKSGLKEEELESLLGKEIAQKIIDSQEDQGVLEGDDLQVGGEGMKKFYDEMIPSAINKFFNKKAWGNAKVELEGVETKGGGGEFVAFYAGNDIGEVFSSEKRAWVELEREAISQIEEYGDGNTSKKGINQWYENAEAGVREEKEPTTAKLHKLKITPEMKSKALRQGMPLFQSTEDFLKSLDKTEPTQKTDRVYTSDQQDFKDVGGFGKKSKKTYRERFDQAKVLAGDKLRQGVIDQFHSLNKVLGDKKAWMLAHLTKSDTGVLMTAINEGTPFLDESGAVDIKEGSKSLKEILAPLGEETDDFLAWIAANRSEKLLAEDRENLFTPKQIAAGKTLNRGREKLYDAVRKEFEDLGAAITDIAVKTNLVNEEEAQQWIEEGFYVPFYRMLEEQETGRRGPGNINGLTNQKAYKKLKGGKSHLDDLLTNTLLNWNHLISAGLRNQAGKKALESAVEMGLASVVPKAIKSKDAVYIRENGQEVWYELDQTPEGQLVLDSVLSLSYEGLNTPSMKAMRMFKRVLTRGVTASPGFKIRNLIRDSLHAPAVTTASKNPLKNIAVGFKNKATMKRMEAGGGAFSQEGYIHGNDPEASKRLIGVASSSILNTTNKIARMWRQYEGFGNTLENINRVASFQKDLAKGKTLLEANFNARDQLDFSRSGSFSSVRVLTQTIPFLNARFQGLDKISRAAMDPAQRKQFAQVVGMYTIASVALMLAMAGDDDYEEAQEWEKRTYHMFKIPGVDKMFRIPRPFEVGAIAYMNEQMARQFLDANSDIDELGSALYHTMTDTFAFSVVPQAFKPLLEVYANKDSFRNTKIESMSMQYLSKKERYKPWTSDTAKGSGAAMSAVLPEGSTLSPVQIQHLVRAYTGWAGATTLASIDFVIKKINGDVTPETKLSEYTWNPVSSFARDSEARSSKYVNKFYENLSELDKMWGDIRKYRGTPNGKIVTLKQRHKLRYRKTYNKISKRLSDIRKRERRIYKSTNMTAGRKRVLLDETSRKKNALAKRMVTISNDVF